MTAKGKTDLCLRAPAWLMLLFGAALFAFSGLAIANGEAEGNGNGEAAAAQEESDSEAEARPDGDEGDREAVREGEVRIGRLLYTDETDQCNDQVCFATDFLTTVDRAGVARVERRMYDLDLSSDDLAEYPFLIMTGNGRFELDEERISRFRHHLESGGFIVASAACSDHGWGRSFRAMIDEAFPDKQLEPLPMDHAIFHTLYQIDRIDLRRETTQPPLYGLKIDGNLSLVFTPVGLNDSSNAGAGYGCCGGNEIRNARLINANLLTWALMR